MKKFLVLHAGLLSTLVALVSNFEVCIGCHFIFHQPEVPKELKEKE